MNIDERETMLTVIKEKLQTLDKEARTLRKLKKDLENNWVPTSPHLEEKENGK